MRSVLRIVMMLVSFSVCCGAAQADAGPDSDGPTAKIQAVLEQQCALVKARDFDGYARTFTTDFSQSGPWPNENTTAASLVALEKLTTTGFDLTHCNVTVRRVEASPLGTVAAYNLLEHYGNFKLLGANSRETETEALALFVVGDDAQLRIRKITRIGFRTGQGRGNTVAEGSFGPAASAAPHRVFITPTEAAEEAHIDILSCTSSTGTSGTWERTKYGPEFHQGAPSLVGVKFVNTGDVVVKKVDVTWYLPFAGEQNLTFKGTFSPKIPIVKLGASPVFKPPEPTCLVTAVERADGTTWSYPTTTMP